MSTEQRMAEGDREWLMGFLVGYREQASKAVRACVATNTPYSLMLAEKNRAEVDMSQRWIDFCTEAPDASPISSPTRVAPVVPISDEGAATDA